MPFLTEELWHALYASVDSASPAKSIALTRYPQAEDFATDDKSVRGMRRIQDFITTIRNRRKELGVPEKESVGIFVVFDAGSGHVYIENEDAIRRLARVSSMEQKSVDDIGRTRELGWVSALGPELAVLYERQIDVPAERERLTKDLAKYAKGVEAADKQLGNEGFIARAPAHIVEGLRKQHAETLALKQKAEAALAALPAE